jgi:BirA family transcriptional regulator, biotin operon repressor / biotin---[acetyl-CoA-carboxylase] ligase
MSAFNLDRIAESGLIGTIDYHDCLGSTNDRALDIGARDELKLPALVLTEHQTAGRGRGTNRWSAGAGSLTFSVIQDAPVDQLPIRRWPQVALAAGLAVCDALQHFATGAKLHVKWPNDVYLCGRKICGILSESISGSRHRLVVGIGINVNNILSTSASLPITQDLDTTATSLIHHDNVARNLTEVLLAVIQEFDRRWRQLLGNQFELIAADYRQRCLLSDKNVNVEVPGARLVFGTCRGIDDDGALLLHTETGMERIVSGTIVSWES